MTTEKTEQTASSGASITGVQSKDQSTRNTVIAIAIVAILLSGIFGLGGGYLSYKYFSNPLNNTKLAQNTIVLQDSAITQTVKNINPSVVSITVKETTYNIFGQSRQSTGSGSGFIVSTDGLILTNKHVASSTDGKYTVTTSDGKQYPAEVKSQDPKYDLAILKISATGLKPVSFGDSDKLKVGQTAIAMGNPLGQYQNTVTVGVISGLGRSIEAGDASGGTTEQLDNLLQTDAAINPGNSGGPLVDASGAVLGVVTAVDSSAQGIGFALPINLAKSALETYLKTGKITRGYLGVRYVTITQDYANQNKLSINHGALISGGNGTAAIVTGSPADKAGLKEGDIITKIGAEDVSESQTLSTLIAKYGVGSKVQITYVRDGKTKTAVVSLEKGQ
jgi:serine protease Do